MLAQTSAYILGADNAAVMRLDGLVRSAGFAQTRRFVSASDVVQRRHAHIAFIFLDEALDPATLAAVRADIRGCADAGLRFMPIIQFSRDVSAKARRAKAALGFDDVIDPEGTGEEIARRLEMQLDRNRDYFETATYFGPDRRLGRAADAGPGLVVHPCRHYVIRRIPASGIKVVRQEEMGSARASA